MSESSIQRGDVWWVSLDPSQGPEIKKTRPCVIVTHNTLNQIRRTVVIVPLSTAAKPHPPITVPVTCEKRPAVAIIDQLRAVGKHRLSTKIETMNKIDFTSIEKAIGTILEIS